MHFWQTHCSQAWTAALAIGVAEMWWPLLEGQISPNALCSLQVNIVQTDWLRDTDALSCLHPPEHTLMLCFSSVIPALNPCWGCSISTWNFDKMHLHSFPESTTPNNHVLHNHSVREHRVITFSQSNKMICRLAALTTLCVPEQPAWWQCAVQVLTKSTWSFPKLCTYSTSVPCFCCSYIIEQLDASWKG